MIDDWTNDKAWCGCCGAEMELVRPGKHQALCDCYDLIPCNDCGIPYYKSDGKCPCGEPQ